jgi:hypothetical protein
MRLEDGMETGIGRETKLPADAVQKTIDALIIERQDMRLRRASRDVLEANRRAIVYWQRELGYARRTTP